MFYGPCPYYVFMFLSFIVFPLKVMLLEVFSALVSNKNQKIGKIVWMSFPEIALSHHSIFVHFNKIFKIYNLDEFSMNRSKS